jgi:hypothetical protein
MSSFVDTGEDRNWSGFLARWSLFAGVAVLALMVTFLAGVLPAAQSSDLPQRYFELGAAIENPAVYRLTISLDIALWMALGGFLVALGALVYRRAPVRGGLVVACGAGQLSGVIGAFMRLNGTSGTAGLYEGASADRQEALLQSYSYMQSAVFSHFNAGSLLWGMALLLAASAIWSAGGYPRWLVVVIALPGLLRLPVSVAEIATGLDLGFVILPQSLLLIVAFLSVFLTFRRRSPAAAPARSGATG